MIEAEKKSSVWPWIVVPAASLAVFLLLRECQHRLPRAEQAAPETTAPAPAAPAAVPAPQ